MTNSSKKNYLTAKVDEVDVHELAHLTPTMTEVNFNALKLSLQEHGQELPIVLFKGKCIDGRHRLKALRELGIEDVYYINEDSQMSIEDIRTKILGVYECRRHQTPTQKAIMAYKEYSRTKLAGDKTGQGEIADVYGTTRKQIGRVQKLRNLAGDAVIELLFNGNKMNIGSVTNPNNTDSLDSLIKYFAKHAEYLVEQSEATKINEDFTDDELASIESTLVQLQSEYSVRMLNKLNTSIYQRILGASPSLTT